LTRPSSLRCSFVLPSLAAGGAERVALQLAEGLAAPRPLSKVSVLGPQAFDLELVVLDPAGPLAESVPDSIVLTNLNRPRIRSALPRLYRHLKKVQPHLIFSTFAHITPFLAAMVPLLPVRPLLVARESNLPSLKLSRQGIDRWVRVGCRFGYPRADLVLASSKTMATELQRDFEVPEERLVVLHNPVNVSLIRRMSAAPVPRTPGRLFVSAGRMVRQKGFDRLIRAWTQLPQDCSLVLIGEGPDRREMEILAQQLGLADRVRFLGYVDNPWCWCSHADAVLLPSRFEGMPNIALEALACGTPVVATPQTGGLPEVAEDAQARYAIHIAPFDTGEFMRVILGIQLYTGTIPRPSKLPANYGLDEVVMRFRDILIGTWQRRFASAEG